MDRQDGQDTGLKHEQITGEVIGCAFEVTNELGAGFLESVYEKALLLVLRQKRLVSVVSTSGHIAIRLTPKEAWDSI